MRKLILLGAVLGLSACSPKATQEACPISDMQTYIGNQNTEFGKGGPNRAGIDAFNQRILVRGFKNRRKSEFGFKIKGTPPNFGKAIEALNCKSEKLICEEPTGKHCQSFTCEVVLPAGTDVNIIDTPRSEFYRTTEATFMQWDGQNLKCKPH